MDMQLECVDSITRATGEVIHCTHHEGPWHVGRATDIGYYKWPREPVRPFPWPRQNRDQGASTS